MDYLLIVLNQLALESGYTGFIFAALIGAAVSVSAYAGFMVVHGMANPTRRRVEAMAVQKAGEQRSTPVARWRELLDPYSEHVLPASGEERSRVQAALIHAGFRTGTALQSFYAMKALLMVSLPVLVFGIVYWLPGVTTVQVLTSAGIAASIGMLAPNYVLHKLVEKRQRKLSVGLPDALDLLVVCSEAGLGLKAAIQRVGDELRVSHPELSDELALVGAETRAGVDRAEALQNLSRRTGMAELQGLVALLAQTLRFGTSIADALRIYAEEFRDRRTQAAEEQAAKIGTKMIFPLVFCLFPSFFLVTAGPAIVGVMAMFR